jgi:hypothetical protein
MMVIYVTFSIKVIEFPSERILLSFLSGATHTDHVTLNYQRHVIECVAPVLCHRTSSIGIAGCFIRSQSCRRYRRLCRFETRRYCSDPKINRLWLQIHVFVYHGNLTKQSRRWLYLALSITPSVKFRNLSDITVSSAGSAPRRVGDLYHPTVN